MPRARRAAPGPLRLRRSGRGPGGSVAPRPATALYRPHLSRPSRCLASLLSVPPRGGLSLLGLSRCLHGPLADDSIRRSRGRPRDARAGALGELVHRGIMDTVTAAAAGRQVLADNARRVYNLKG